MANDTFQLSVVTPEKAVLDGEVTSVIFPAHDGEIGILHGRAPLLYKLGIGRLKAEMAEGTKVLFVDGGFAQMVDNRLTILTEQALEPSEIDSDRAEAALKKALDSAHSGARLQAVARAKAQLKLAAGE